MCVCVSLSTAPPSPLSYLTSTILFSLQILPLLVFRSFAFISFFVSLFDSSFSHLLHILQNLNIPNQTSSHPVPHKHTHNYKPLTSGSILLPFLPLLLLAFFSSFWQRLLCKHLNIFIFCVYTCLIEHQSNMWIFSYFVFCIAFLPSTFLFFLYPPLRARLLLRISSFIKQNHCCYFCDCTCVRHCVFVCVCGGCVGWWVESCVVGWRAVDVWPKSISCRSNFFFRFLHGWFTLSVLDVIVMLPVIFIGRRYFSCLYVHRNEISIRLCVLCLTPWISRLECEAVSEGDRK